MLQDDQLASLLRSARRDRFAPGFGGRVLRRIEAVRTPLLGTVLVRYFTWLVPAAVATIALLAMHNVRTAGTRANALDAVLALQPVSLDAAYVFTVAPGGAMSASVNIDIKAAAILLGTLLLGVILGAVGSGALAHQRRDALDRLRRPQGFVAHMEDVIGPHDSNQRQAVMMILNATAARNDTIVRGANEALRATLESMRTQLAPVLDADQQRRLADDTQMAPPLAPPGEGRAGRGPPPDGRHPPPEGSPRGLDRGPPEGPPRRPPPGGQRGPR